MTDLHVEVRPGGTPAMVWGHGLLQSIPTGPLDPLALELDNEVVAYDARNHGASPEATSSDELTWPALAADLLAVADHAGHQRFIAGGVSMGAATALTAALEAPERVTALALVIPPTAWTFRWGQRALYGGLGSLGALLPFGEVRRAARSLRGASRTDLPSLERIHEISVPTIVFSWHFDPSHPHAVGRRIADAIGGAEFVSSPRPGDATGWAERLAGFVQRC